MRSDSAAPAIGPFVLSLTAGLLVCSSLLAQERGGRGRGFRPPPPPVLVALDTDKDGSLSKTEIENAKTTLATLDENEDGELAGDEIAPSFFGRRPPPGMMSMLPIMKALDVDSDEILSKDELDSAVDSLWTLDKDEDGTLAESELMPSFGRGGRGPGGFGRRASGPMLEPAAVKIEDGAATIPDRKTFQTLSYRGTEVLIDTHLKDLEFVKFHLQTYDDAEPKLYFINTNTHRAHMMFMAAAGIPRGGSEQMKGVLIYRPMLKSPSGQTGLFTFEFEPTDAYAYDMVQLCHDHLVKFAPMLKGNLAYHPLPRAMDQYEDDKEQYEKAGLPVFLPDDLYGDIVYLPLNPSVGFGRLRIIQPDERPSPRDVVIYDALPNEMPRVAGILTGVRQTPLSHVNLRAVQDGVPNAFVDGASQRPEVQALVGKYVRYSVGKDGYDLREATYGEVEKHFASMRPKQRQVPERDLSVTTIRTLDDVEFSDFTSVGVKAANLATLRRVSDLAEGVVPDGHAVPFYFYDAFMKHNRLYAAARAMVAEPEFRQDADAREQALRKFRKKLRRAEMPESLRTALGTLQRSFGDRSMRCRSSTNNEDLPGFSGAGLYDSFTHRPDEGHLEKSIKQVFASLWNFRAFEEREFYRIDHFATAMGVLIHTNYSDEVANGVAVTDDIVYQTPDARRYYVNVQVGEDLVTNPEDASIPEEILLHTRTASRDVLVRSSNRVATGERVLNEDHLDELRSHLRSIHRKFRKLYGKKLRDQFAIEIEFKITAKGELAIKQARPWVY